MNAEWLLPTQNTLWLRAFFLGVSSGLFCVTSCIPFVAPYLVMNRMTLREADISILKFLAGRWVGYLSLGFLLGALGSRFETAGFNRWLGLLMVIPALVLLAAAVKSNRSESCAGKSPGRATPFWMGLFMGANLCPPFLLSMGDAMRSGSAFRGAFFFSLFFLGTCIYFLPFRFLGLIGRSRPLRVAARASAWVVALLFLFHGFYDFFMGAS